MAARSTVRHVVLADGAPVWTEDGRNELHPSRHGHLTGLGGAFGRHAPRAARVLRAQGPVATGCAPPGKGALPRDTSARPGFWYNPHIGTHQIWR